MNILNARGKLRKAFMKEQSESPDKVEYYFIDMEGNKIAVFPYERILNDVFVNCICIESKKVLTIHKNRLCWNKIEK